jgi:hypothetical protein
MLEMPREVEGGNDATRMVFDTRAVTGCGYHLGDIGRVKTTSI